MTAAFQANTRDGQSTPLVTVAESNSDIQFFFENSHRCFRVSDRWVVRRRGGVFLRTPLPASHGYVDTEPAAERCWPQLDPQTRAALAKAARRRGFSGKKTT